MQITENLHGQPKGIHFDFMGSRSMFVCMFTADKKEDCIGMVFSEELVTLLAGNNFKFPIVVRAQSANGRVKCTCVIDRESPKGAFQLEKLEQHPKKRSINTRRSGRRVPRAVPLFLAG